MKISVDIDISPTEMRKLMGLPDVEPFQQELMDELRDKMKAGVYDPAQLFQPYVASTLASWDVLQKLMRGAVSSYGAGEKKKEAG
jgi:hypothetical protein